MKFWIVLYNILLLFCLTKGGVNNMNMHEGVSSPEIINGDTFFQILEPPQLSYTYRIRPARNFGGKFDESWCSKSSKLVLMDPMDGCTPPFNQDYIQGNVAFAVRGSCSFLHKTLIAEEAGARGIIITEIESDKRNSGAEEDLLFDQFIEMIDDKSDGDPTIPAGFLLGRNGGQIIRAMSRLKLEYASIKIPVNMTNIPIHKMNQPPWTSW